MIGNVATEDLVLDPALQCRVGLDEETVDDYAAAMKDAGGWPAGMPPVRAWRIDGDEALLLTDGWHRQAAASKAGLEEVPVDIRDGNRREALLDAIGANASHGRRRTREDVQRAVTALLQDAEWCEESNRGLAELAKVSHTHVANIRRRYGVKRGERLTPSRVEEVDGEAPPAWKALVAEADWMESSIEKVRRAGNLAEVRKAIERYGHMSVMKKAAGLRLQELAEANPVEDDFDDFDALDTIEDLEAALLSPACPDRAAMLEALRVASSIQNGGTWQLEQAEEVLAGRPAFEQAIADRRKELAEKSASRPPSAWELRTRVEEESDPERQAELVREHVGHVHHLSWRKLGGPARLALREEVAKTGPVADCAYPGCDGYVRTEVAFETCIACQRRPSEVPHIVQQTLEKAEALCLAGVALELGGVVVNPEAVEVLEVVGAALRDENFAAWITGPAGPPALAPALLAWQRSIRKRELEAAAQRSA